MRMHSSSPSRAPFTAVRVSKISTAIPMVVNIPIDRLLKVVTSLESMHLQSNSSRRLHKMVKKEVLRVRHGWMERLADSADLQGEAFPGQSVVELFGERRLLVEHHGGVTEYGREKIILRMKFGYLCVCGGCLELAKMNAEQLVITGRIDSISLVRRR